MKKPLFDKKTVVITGSSSGIGKAMAFEFAKNGANLALCSINKAELDQAIEELKTAYPQTEIYGQFADLRTQKDCIDFIENTVDRFRRIDVLINNAGITYVDELKNLDTKEIENVMQLNFFGTVYCTKAALNYITETKGSIVGISSIAGLRGIPKRTGYSASKFAVQGFFESLRAELMNDGVNVLVVAPWFTKTAIRVKTTTKRDESSSHTPEYVAQEIVKAVALRKRDLVLGGLGKFTAAANHFFPKVIDRLLVKYFAKKEKADLK